MPRCVRRDTSALRGTFSRSAANYFNRVSEHDAVHCKRGAEHSRVPAVSAAHTEPSLTVWDCTGASTFWESQYAQRMWLRMAPISACAPLCVCVCFCWREIVLNDGNCGITALCAHTKCPPSSVLFRVSDTCTRSPFPQAVHIKPVLLRGFFFPLPSHWHQCKF